MEDLLDEPGGGSAGTARRRHVSREPGLARLGLENPEIDAEIPVAPVGGVAVEDVGVRVAHQLQHGSRCDRVPAAVMDAVMPTFAVDAVKPNIDASANATLNG